METTAKLKDDVIRRKIPVWNPTLNVSQTGPICLSIGIVFIVIGGIILFVIRNTIEFAIDYTDCKSKENPSVLCSDKLDESPNGSCVCEIPFEIEADIPPAVNVYYALTRFYQNHRRYLVSRDNRQLLGNLETRVSTDCRPYDYAVENGVRKPIAPCGAIANSMFSDRLQILNVNLSSTVPLLNRGITWPDLKIAKYRNPEGDLKKAFEKFAKPPAWRKHIWELDPTNDENNAFQNEDFIVWMQPATLPNFKKLYRRVDHSVGYYEKGLPKGRYVLLVDYSFPVKVFKGTKSFVLANSSILGTKNTFLGKVYVVVGVACVIVSIAFYILHLQYKKIA